jgi:hypothetical protein
MSGQGAEGQAERTFAPPGRSSERSPIVGVAMASQSPAQKKTVERVMHEFKHGELRIRGSGPKVKNPKQAIAIALHEAGASKYESPKENRENLRKTKAKERRGDTGKARAEGRGRKSSAGKSQARGAPARRAGSSTNRRSAATSPGARRCRRPISNARSSDDGIAFSRMGEGRRRGTGGAAEGSAGSAGRPGPHPARAFRPSRPSPIRARAHAKSPGSSRAKMLRCQRAGEQDARAGSLWF